MAAPGWRTALVDRYESRFGPVDRPEVATGFWLFLAGLALFSTGSVLEGGFIEAFVLFLTLPFPSPFADVLPRVLKGTGFVALLAGPLLRRPVGRLARLAVYGALAVAPVALVIGWLADSPEALPRRPFLGAYVGAAIVVFALGLLSLLSPADSARRRSPGPVWWSPAGGRWLSGAGLVTGVVGLAVFLAAAPTAYQPVSAQLFLGVVILQLGFAAFVAGVLVELPLGRIATKLVRTGVGLGLFGVGATVAFYALAVLAAVRLPDRLTLLVGASPFVGLALVVVVALLSPWLAAPDRDSAHEDSSASDGTEG